MKNKALTYVLLLVVAFIWYQVFFRVKGNLEGGDNVAGNQTTMITNIPSLIRDTVTLNADYRDPFGMEKLKSMSINPEVLSQHARKPKPQPQQIIWPSMVYFGMLNKQSSKKPLAIISVDNIQLMIRQGQEVFDGIYIVKVMPKSVTVRYKKEIKEVFIIK